MKRNAWQTILNAYKALKQHEWYWMMDRDYRMKYSYVKDAATTDEPITWQSLEYVADCAEMLLAANNRIFRR